MLRNFAFHGERREAVTGRDAPHVRDAAPRAVMRKDNTASAAICLNRSAIVNFVRSSYRNVSQHRRSGPCRPLAPPRSLKGSPMSSTRFIVATACLAAPLLVPLSAAAQVTVKDDGQWRSLLSAGASVSSGNSDSTTITLSGEAVKATTYDKWSMNARALYVKNDESEAEQRFSAGTHYQRDITDRIFGFGQFDALRDEPANLSSRLSAGGGLGYHVIKRDDLTFDVSGGVGYTRERYVEPEIYDGELRSRYNNTELLLAEESTHKISDTTTFRQKLSYLPNLRNSDQYRAVFDAGISVAMTQRLSLTATVSHRHNSDPGEGLKKGDTLFITGVSFRID